MTGLSQPPAALLNTPPALLELYRAWQGCRRHNALVPSLSDYLDAPSFRLQPVVAIGDIYSPTDIRIRLAGTGLVTLAGQDFTHEHVTDLIDPESLAAVGPEAWRAIKQPAGYTQLFTLRSANGLYFECFSLSLPLLPPASVPGCILTMMHIPSDVPRLPGAQETAMITSFKMLDWIDIGAGLPTTGT